MKPTHTRANAPINTPPITEQEFKNKYADRVRHGKTKKDRGKGGEK